MPVCPNCGNQAAENAIFCDQCGTRLPAAVASAAAAPAVVTEPDSAAGGVPEGVLICPNCGAENVPGEVFCDVCGEPLEAPEPVPSEAVTEPEVEVETVLEVAAEMEAEPIAVAEPVSVEQTYCPVCGAAVHPADTFCGTCGASLSAAAEEQALVEEPAVIEPAEEAAPAAVPVEAEAEPIEEIVVGEQVEEPILVEAEEAPLEGAVILEAEEEPLEEAVVVEAEEGPLEPVVVAEVEGEPIPETLVVAEPELAVAVDTGELRCPVCGARVLPDQRFCASCGAALPAAEEAVTAQGAVAEEVVPVPGPEAPPLAIGPHLEVADSGAHIPLIDQPELLVGRVDDVSGIYPDVDMTPHGGEEGGVSRRHALLVHEQDAWYVVDLDSTNGTYVNGAEVSPQVRVRLQDGDRISFGDSNVVLHTQ